MLNGSIWGLSCRFTSSALAAFFFLIIASQSVFAGTYSVLAPQGFQRQTGAPVTENISFSVANPAGTYTISIYNGGLDDHELTGELVSSSIISLNGTQIFGPSEFNKNVTTLTKSISLQGDNELSVELRGKPGGVITLTITGEDSDLPTIVATLSSAANSAGWHNSDVKVSFDCNDATSGIASCTPPVDVASEGEMQVITGVAIDQAGNEATTSVSLNLDKTAPALQFVSPQAGEVVSSQQPSILISASDNFEIDVSSLSLLLNGAAFGGSCGFDSGIVICQPNSDLPAGITNLEASLADIAGNIGSAQLSFQIVPDSDGDGVGDNSDQCPNSPAGESVNAFGCALSELDSDEDGVTDDIDQCPGTPAGVNVDSAGCPIVVGDDADGDTVPDNDDNCPTVFNPDQADADGDGTGDACEPVGSVTIVSPIEAEVINSSTISVTGTINAPQASGVSVNLRDACVYENQFVVNNIPINSGDYSIQAQIAPPDGIGAADQVTVNRNGDSTYSVDLNSNCAVTPFEAEYRFENIDSNIVQLGIDFESDGVVDAVLSDLADPVFTHRYENPGVIRATITGIDANGLSSVQSLALIVQDSLAIDAEIQTCWQNITASLSSNNIEQALNELTPRAREMYRPSFEALQNDLPSIMNSFSELQIVDINVEYAEYAVNRIINGENRLFLIYFVKDGNGEWKLESM